VLIDRKKDGLVGLWFFGLIVMSGKSPQRKRFRAWRVKAAARAKEYFENKEKSNVRYQAS